MYIRRKVFSLLNVDGEDRYFSTTEFELTDGSESRYFSDSEDKKGMSKAAKIALATGAGLATVAGGLYGAKKGAFGNRAGMAVNKAIMRGAGRTGNRKAFESAAKDYAVQSVKNADKVKNVKTMDAAGKKAFLKRVSEAKKSLMDAFDVQQGAKAVKKSGGKSKGPKLSS